MNFLTRKILFPRTSHTLSRCLNMSAPKDPRVALCQFKIGSDKEANIKKASQFIDQTGEADIIVLPECWNSPYAVTSFPEYAEPIPDINQAIDQATSPSTYFLSQKAKERNAWIIGGSIPERDIDNKIYNTSIIFNNEGHLIAKHRKVHLFDINVPGKITFKESDSLTPGSNFTLINTPWGHVGIGICYDIRFPEYSAMLRKLGAKILIFPGAFNMVTGPAHWELLQRGRAVDNQTYVITCSPARDTESGGYVAWGHSSCVNPWGEVITKAQEGEEVVTTTLEMNMVDEMRQNIPCWTQKRNDLYTLNATL